MFEDETAIVTGQFIDVRTGLPAVLDDDMRAELHAMVHGMTQVIDTLMEAMGHVMICDVTSDQVDQAKMINGMMLTVALMSVGMHLPDGTPLDTEHMRLPVHIATMLKDCPEAFKPEGWDSSVDSVTDWDEISTEGVDAFLATLFPGN